MPGESIFANRDPLDIDNVLFKIEASFNFRFGDNELKDVRTFGELCDAILQKLQLPDGVDCTTQQAFYKLRAVCCETMGVRGEAIVPSTRLNDMFPRATRRKNIQMVETILGVSIKILRPKHWLSRTLVIMLLFSLFALYFEPKFGILTLLFSLAGLYVSSKLGREFEIETVADLVRKMTRENYLKSRRSPITVNKKEVVAQVQNLFAFELGIDREAFGPETKF